MRHRTMLASMAWLVGVLFVASVSFAEDKDKDKKEAGDFLTKASQCNQLEIKLGELASEKATSPEVKEFARQMVEEHRKADKMLLEGGTKPAANAEIDAKHKEAWERLNKLSGEEFDREYMKMQVEGHKKAVEMFKKQAESGEDNALKATAGKLLPDFQKHLEKAQQIADKIK